MRAFELIKLLLRSSPHTRKLVTRLGYEVMARAYAHPGLTFMNYGYAALAGDGHVVELEARDELNRYQIQLYLQIAAGVNLRGKLVLEIGAGRGGGAAFLMRHLAPASVTGVEIAPTAVALSRAVHQQPGLTFLCGDAERLPFPAASFDVVVNVESSHCYGSMRRFLAEVRRVLRPGGHFLFGDLRDTGEVDALRGALAAAGLECLEEQDITAPVVAALDRTNAAKEALIRQAPFWARRLLRDQSGVRGGIMDRELRGGRRVYWRGIWRQPAGTP